MCQPSFFWLFTLLALHSFAKNEETNQRRLINAVLVCMYWWSFITRRVSRKLLGILSSRRTTLPSTRFHFEHRSVLNFSLSCSNTSSLTKSLLRGYFRSPSALCAISMSTLDVTRSRGGVSFPISASEEFTANEIESIGPSPADLRSNRRRKLLQIIHCLLGMLRRSHRLLIYQYREFMILIIFKVNPNLVRVTTKPKR